MVKRIAAIAVVYLVAVVGWITLAGTISYRTENQDAELKQRVGHLWGTPLEQKAPSAVLIVENKPVLAESGRSKKVVIVRAASTDKYDLPLVQSDINVGFELDQRQKGLLWYSTYRVRFAGEYKFDNTQDKNGALTVNFAFPAADGQYDEFKFEVDGTEVPFTRQSNNSIAATVACAPKSRHRLSVNYYSQGLDRFIYRFGDGIGEVRDFKLVAATDFDGYDHPSNTLSPNVPKERKGSGWQLTWTIRISSPETESESRCRKRSIPVRWPREYLSLLRCHWDSSSF